MKFTLNWLKDHLDTNATLAEISTKLTAIGLEVEEIIDTAETLKPFTVAEILEAQQHPDADKLRVCKVNTGKDVLQIVCGAPNARAGIKVALASVGTVIPTNQLQIRASKIRGVESNGMLCSARELGLGNDHEGIIELPATAPLGESIVGVLGLDDPVIHINLTPNRPDCLGVRGIARDLAATGIGTLKPLKTPAWNGKGTSAISVALEEKGCHQFIGCHLRGVKNGPSPEWLQQRLRAIGLRPISALVDVTNYFSVDLCRPLHVYDANKLQGGIVVRSTREGESFAALNDKTYTVGADHVGITDGSGLIGLGGIIGGTSTGCDESTSDVFLECAYFEPSRIAATGRALQIDSDARYRFERGVDPAFLEQGAKLAVQMILDLCGGEASELVMAGKATDWQRNLPFDPEAINRLSGVPLSREQQQAILTSLGFEVKGDSATPPSWRGDIEGTADLAEEVLRIHGFDNIPVTSLEKLPQLTGTMLTPMQRRTSAVRRILAARGMHEVQSWSFMASPHAALFGGQDSALELMNPISSELDTMRPSILPNLIQAASRNAARSFPNQRLFEIGIQFSGLGETGQHLMATALRAGNAQDKSPLSDARAHDALDAKADALAIIDASDFDSSQLQIKREAPAWYHPGRSGSLCMGKQIIATFGEIHPAVLKSLDAPERMVGCEVFLAAIPVPKRKGTAKAAYMPSDYQAVTRDFAFIVDAALPANDLIRAVAAGDKKLIRDVTLFDLYQGKGVADGKKSLAVTVTLQAQDRTLSEADIETASKGILQQATKIGATLRI
jgi:phenylalanyl-tRNA synthetase beta chain